MLLSKKERAALVKDLAGYDQVAKDLALRLEEAHRAGLAEVAQEIYERRAGVLKCIKDLERSLRR